MSAFNRALAAFSFLWAGSVYPCSAQILDKAIVLAPISEALIIASEGARPPFNYLDNNSELAGFEIDLGRALCEQMHKQCLFVAQNWDDMVPQLLAHHSDAIMAAMEITDARRAQIAFSQPYVRMPSTFMTQADSDQQDATPKDLDGKTIGVIANGPHQSYLEDNYKQSTVYPFATLEEAILDLAEGRLDVVFGDKDAVMDFLEHNKEGKCCRFLADVPFDSNYFGEGVGIGLRKTDEDLRVEFNKALDKLHDNGTYSRIAQKYFPFSIY